MKNLANVKMLVDDAVGALYDALAWAEEDDHDQAQAALEDARSNISSIAEWLEEDAAALEQAGEEQS